MYINIYIRNHLDARAVQHYTSRLTRVFIQSLGWARIILRVPLSYLRQEIELSSRWRARS